MLRDYSWSQKDLNTTEYAGKYVTHDFVNKDAIIRTLDSDQNDLEPGEHKLTYDGEEMNVDLRVNRDYVQFFYDKTFERKLGDEEFEKVITHFLTPEKWKPQSGLDEN